MAKTILVVDDDADILEMVKIVLEEKGHHVVTSSDGKSCFRDIIAKKPDLIILDIRMPNMDGLNALDMIKVTKLSRQVPIMVWSGEADPVTMAKAEKLGADDFIEKSLSMNDFAKRVNSHLFSINFAILQDLLKQVPAAKSPGPSLGLTSFEYKEWEWHFLIYKDNELGVCFNRGVTLQSALKLEADRAQTQIAVLIKIGNHWKRLWPKP